MDIEFLIQDTYNVLRPQWKLASDLEEAGRLFSEAVAQNYQKALQDGDKAMEPDEEDVESVASDNDNMDEGLEDDVPEAEESTTEEEVRVKALFPSFFV